MPRYAIAFNAPSGKLHHEIVEMDSQNAALRFFFTNFVSDDYSSDDEGFTYFTEDFNDPDEPLGHILEI